MGLLNMNCWCFWGGLGSLIAQGLPVGIGSSSYTSYDLGYLGCQGFDEAIWKQPWLRIVKIIWIFHLFVAQFSQPACPWTQTSSVQPRAPTVKPKRQCPRQGSGWAPGNSCEHNEDSHLNPFDMAKSTSKSIFFWFLGVEVGVPDVQL